MNRIFILFAFLILSISISFSQEDNNYNLLWKIEGNGLKEASYIFGTMHVEDNRAFNFPDSVMIAIKNVEAFANEIHFDSVLYEMFDMMFGSPDKENSIKELLTDEEYQKLSQLIEKEMGFPLDATNIKSPFFLEQMIGSPDPTNANKNGNYQNATFVDGHLLGIAKTLRKKIYGLERIEDQMESFELGTKEEKRQVLLRIIDPDIQTKYADAIDDLIEIYQTGDLKKIEAYVGSDIINDPILAKRNHVMANSIERISKTRSLFSAVGAAHIPGKEGVVALLRKKGFILTPVQATYTGITDNFEVNVMKMDWVQTNQKENGFKVKAPGNIVKLNFFKGINSWGYPDISTGNFYLILKIDMPPNSYDESKDDEIYNNLLVNATDKAKHIISSGRIELEDGSALKIAFQDDDGSYQNIRYLIRKGTIWGLLLTSEKENLSKEISDRFFNSFKTYKVENPEFKPKEKADWTSISNEEEGTEFLLPGEPKIKEMEVDMVNQDGKIKIKQYVLDDNQTPNFYIVQHFSFPFGTYMKDPENQIREIEKRIGNKFGDISYKKDIKFGIYEGNDFITSKEGHSISVRSLVRGNKFYNLMHVQAEEKLSWDSTSIFFNNFKYIPFKKCELTTIENKTLNFKIDLPKNNVLSDITEMSSTNDQLKVEQLIESTNPYSTGNYTIFVSEFNEHFYYPTLDSFYRDLVRYRTLDIDDTLEYLKPITLSNGLKGYEARSGSKILSPDKLTRFFINGNHHFQILLIDSDEELAGETVQSILNSFEITKIEKPFDYSSSKTEQIFDHLTSSDSLLYQKAFAALDYHSFEKEEVDLILKQLEREHPMAKKEDAIKEVLFETARPFINESHFDLLKKYYTKFKDYKNIPNTILFEIGAMKRADATDQYLSLLLDDTPNNSYYSDFLYFRDSLELVIENFPRFLKFTNPENDYYTKFYYLVNQLLNQENPKFNAAIQPYAKQLLVNAEREFEAYQSSVIEEENPNAYAGLNFQFLNIVQQLEEKEISERYTRKIVDFDQANKLLILQALRIRLSNDWSVPSKSIMNLLNNDMTKIETMKVLHEAGLSKKIPKAYLDQTYFSKLAMETYIYEAYDTPQKLESVGTIKDQGNSYFDVYKITFYEDDYEYTYFSIIGPFQNKKKTLNYNYEAAINWNMDKTISWKEHAAILLKEIKEEEN